MTAESGKLVGVETTSQSGDIPESNPVGASLSGARIVRSRRQLAAACSEFPGRRGLVMTMGALHEGHLDLIRAIRPHCDHVVVSIFVNPTQFAPGEDFTAYPRDLQADLALLEPLGVEIVFAPTPEVIYPPGANGAGNDSGAGVRIDPGPLATVLEGATRPTHFAGVTQVVAKVFHLVAPDVAAFGRKDAQQLAIISAMVRDLDFPVQVLPVDIRREPDGLAMSSRNAYLSAEERARALSLHRALVRGAQIAAYGSGQADDIVAQAREVLVAAGVEVDYVALVDTDFMPVSNDYSGSATLAVAARVGTTRLIDNMEIKL